MHTNEYIYKYVPILYINKNKKYIYMSMGENILLYVNTVHDSIEAPGCVSFDKRGVDNGPICQERRGK